MFSDGAKTSGEPRAGTDPILFPERNPEAFLALANSHHVVVRALEVFSRLPQVLRRPRILEWASDHLNKERARHPERPIVPADDLHHVRRKGLPRGCDQVIGSLA
jgi:hypothetical protein